MKRRKLLLADDSELNRAILANMLEADFEIIEVSNGKEALAALQTYRSSLSTLLLDIVMPELDGFGVLEEMNRLHWIDALPTIIISAETGGAYIDHAFALGASDYISRPFVPGIIRRRIMNAILLHTKKQQMMDLVADWFSQQGHSDEILLTILEYAVETRSGEGGTHMTGVDTITGLLLRRLLEKPNPYGLTETDVNVICTASGLHDLGKLLVPSEILKKPGKLTAEEFEIVKRHTVMGAQLIADLPVYQNEKLVQYAITICRWHHERWNGEGYPDGLWGDGIPIAAQVVSLADAYDALTNARSYKTAFDHETALAMLHNGECGSFNPLLLTCLDEVSETIRQAKQERRILQNKPTVQKAVDELYNGQDLPTVRVAQQLEEYRTQHRFFSDLTQDYWFKYTLQLSRSAAEWLGLPRMIVNPMEHPDALAILGADARETLRQALETRRVDDRYLELTVTIYVNGKPCRCQMALLVFWDAANQDRYRAILGKVLDIDESFGRLTRYDAALAAPAAPALLPVLAGPDDVLQLQSS